FRVLLSDGGSSPRSAASQAQVTVNVTRNQQDPIFFNQVYVATIQESVAIGTSVIDVTAQDSDTNSAFNQISFAVIGDDTAPNFYDVTNLGGGRGRVVTKAVLSTEGKDRYVVRVVARDNGSPSRSGTAVVNVSIQRNFFRPEWVQSNYVASIGVTQTVGVTFITVRANDADNTAPHNTVNYRILTSSNNGTSYFKLDKETGAISVSQPLTMDTTKPSLYTLSVEAYDLGTPSLTATSTVPVTIS
ncbi:hypothetical protein ACJMK2_035670, partial [Sinanodonta woodiana]